MIRQIIRRALERLESPASIRFQLTGNLLLMRIYHIVRRNYTLNNHKFLAISRSDQLSKTSEGLQKSDKQWRHKSPVMQQSYAQLPVPHFALQVYEYLSTCLLIFIIAKNLFPKTASRIAQFLVGLIATTSNQLPAHCYLPGRLLMIEVIRNEFAAAIGIVNLCLRLWPQLKQRPLALSLMDFLYQNPRDLDRYYDAIDDELHNHLPESLSRPRRIPNELQGHPFNRFTCFAVLRNQNTPLAQAYCDRIEYLMLRPNRTRHAHRKLTQTLAILGLFGFVVHAGLILIIMPSLITCLTLDKIYLYQYPHCDPSLEQQQQTTNWLQVTPTRPHHLFVFLFDLIENFIIWFDSALITSGAFLIPVLINLDITRAWRQLYDRIVVRRERNESCELWRHRHHHHHDDRQQPDSKQQRPAWSRQDAELHELKYQVNDFFVQLRQADLLVSDCITLGIVLWLLALTLVANRLLRYFHDHPDFLYDAGIPLSFRAFLTLGVALGSLPISGFSIVMFQVHNHCRQGYEQLCSLIASSTCAYTSSALFGFTRNVHEFFVHHNRTSYRLFQSYPFTSATYWSLISWTATLLALLSNLIDFRRG